MKNILVTGCGGFIGWKVSEQLLAGGTLKCLQPAGYEIFNLGNDNLVGKSKKILGWYPKTTIQEGIKKTVQWYFENREFVNRLKD